MQDLISTLWKGRKLHVPPTIWMLRARAVNVQATKVPYRRMVQKVDPQVFWTGDTENKYYITIQGGGDFTCNIVFLLTNCKRPSVGTNGCSVQGRQHRDWTEGSLCCMLIK